MKKFNLLFLLVFIAQFASADNYSGLGVGIAEACRSVYKPSFSGGDCIHRDIDMRGFMGTDLSDYFSLEANLDFAFDVGNIGEILLDGLLADASDGTLNYSNQNSNSYTTTGRWSVVNLGVHALGKLPVTNNFVVFAGPSFGASYTEVDTGVKYFDNQESSLGDTTYGFGTNYGFVFGFDYFTSGTSAIRVQWQNWRSLDSAAANHGHFNSNTLTINFRENF